MGEESRITPKILIQTPQGGIFCLWKWEKLWWGPDKLQMPVNCQEEPSKAASLQSQKFRRESQAWIGLEQGRVGIACRLFACLGFTGSEMLSRFSERSVILKICRPPARRAACRRDWLSRERPGRVSGQALVFHFHL